MSAKIRYAASTLGNSGQRCSNCHERNHTVRTCRMAKCESVFFCGELSRHPDEKQEFQPEEKKREIAALEMAAAKIELDLKGCKVAFSRVLNNSLNKHIEEILLEEFPHEYFQNNSKKWLKLQQNIAYVCEEINKSQWCSKTRSCEINNWSTKTLIFEDEQRLDISIPSYVRSEKPRKQSAKHKAWASFGITCPDRIELTGVWGFENLLLTSREEEDEQISMATRLSLTDDTPFTPN